MAGPKLKEDVCPGFLSQFLTEPLYLVPEGSGHFDIVILYERPTPLGHTEEKLLNNILKAIKVERHRAKIDNMVKNRPENFNEFEKMTTKVIAFGVDQQWLPAGIEYHQVTQVGEMQVVRSLPLEDLNIDDFQKKKLWGCLKLMFGI